MDVCFFVTLLILVMVPGVLVGGQFLLGKISAIRAMHHRQRESRALLRKLVAGVSPSSRVGFPSVRGIAVSIPSGELTKALGAVDESIAAKYIVCDRSSQRRAWRSYEDWIEAADDSLARDVPILVLPSTMIVRAVKIAGTYHPEPINPSRCVVILPEDGAGERGVTPLAASAFCAAVMRVLQRCADRMARERRGR